MLKILSFVTGGWIGPALLAAALAGAGVWHFSAVRAAKQEGRAEVEQILKTYIQARNELAEREREAVRVKEATHREDIRLEREGRIADKAVSAAAAARVGAQLVGMRGTVEALAARRAAQCQDPGAGPGADEGAAPEWGVLLESFDEGARVAKEADDLADQLRGLQTWARSALKVCARSGE